MTVRLEALQGIQCELLRDATDDVRHGRRLRRVDQRVGANANQEPVDIGVGRHHSVFVAMNLHGLLLGIPRLGSDEKIRPHDTGGRRPRTDASDGVGVSVVVGSDVVLIPRGRHREDQFRSLVEVHEAADVKNRRVPRIGGIVVPGRGNGAVLQGVKRRTDDRVVFRGSLDELWTETPLVGVGRESRDDGRISGRACRVDSRISSGRRLGGRWRQEEGTRNREDAEA